MDRKNILSFLAGAAVLYVWMQNRGYGGWGTGTGTVAPGTYSRVGTMGTGFGIKSTGTPPAWLVNPYWLPGPG